MVLEKSQHSIILQLNPKPTLLLCKVPKSPVNAGWRSSRTLIPCPKSTAPANPLLQTPPHSWIHWYAGLLGVSAAEHAVYDEFREDLGEWTKMSYHKWQVHCSECHNHPFQQFTSSLNISPQASMTQGYINIIIQGTLLLLIYFNIFCNVVSALGQGPTFWGFGAIQCFLHYLKFNSKSYQLSGIKELPQVVPERGILMFHSQ